MTEVEIREKIATETPRVREITLANAHNIPEEFKAIKQWEVYRFDPRKEKNEPGGFSAKLGKPPVSPSSGNPISWPDPKNFLSFDQAAKALKANKPGNLAGIGLVFTGGVPFSGIDIDSCIDVLGDPTDPAREIINRLNSYTEISPSGTGIRIIGRGKLPDGDRGGKCGDYETYSAARFLTLTGCVFDGKRVIREFSADLAWFRKTFATKKEDPSSRGQPHTGQSSGPISSDDDILRRISRAKNAEKIQDLFQNQHKSEDLASLVNRLAFYTRDPHQIERIIRAKCQEREKWNESRGGKSFLLWDIERILAKYRGETYSPNGKSPFSAIPDADPPPEELKVYSAADLEHKEFKPINWIIPEMLPDGFSLLAGKPKKGKSWMALNMALAVASGGKFFGKDVPQGEVLYLALEDGQRRLKLRLRQLCGPGESFPKSLYFVDNSQFPRFNRGGWEALLRHLDKHTNTKLVVIDTLARVMPRQVNQGSQYHHEYDFTAHLQTEATKREIGILSIAHLRKADSDDPFDSISGTLGMTAACDSIWVLKSSPTNRAQATLHTTGRDIQGDDLALSLDDGRWSVVGNAEEVAVSETRYKILEFLRENGAQYPKSVSKALNAVDSTIRSLLFKMKSDGQIQTDPKGRYSLPVIKISQGGREETEF